jgi:predicted DNA-binding protein
VRSQKTARENQVGTRISDEHRQKLDWLAETTGKSFGRIFEEGIDLQVAIEQRKSKGR